ncbi:MAG: translation elongation factor Ts [Anaerolineales bacterium]|nr:translation elongation factor Ts [Anaerolineales bacterium]
MSITTKEIKELREKTSAGFLDCKKALEEHDGDFEKAVDYLRKKGLAKAAKRADRVASEGVLELYNHGDGRVGVMVEINCETDFVARSDAFRELAHELALQIAALSPLWVTEEEIPEEILAKEQEIAKERALQEGKPENIIDRIVDGRVDKFKDEVVLLRQAYIRDDKLTIQELLNEAIVAIGENIIIRRFTRWAVGEKSN